MYLSLHRRDDDNDFELRGFGITLPDSHSYGELRLGKLHLVFGRQK